MSSHVAVVGHYLAGNSRLHAADPRAKLVVALGFILAVTSLPAGGWAALALMAALVWGSAALSGVGLRRIFWRSLLALPFVAAALPTVFTRPGTPFVTLDLSIIQLVGTDQGLEFFTTVLLKSWVCVTAASVLTATTAELELLGALAALRVPAVLVAIISLMYRYIFVLGEEVQRMLRARTARSAAIGPHAGGSIPWRARVAGGMAGSLFIRTYDRSERIYLAMLARGYDGQVRQVRRRCLRSSPRRRNWLRDYDEERS
jgi:cobalt/nickel transport system permease protein